MWTSKMQNARNHKWHKYNFLAIDKEKKITHYSAKNKKSSV